MQPEIVEIKTSFGGPCVYKRAVFSDGRTSGPIQATGQSQEKLEQELTEALETGRDDVGAFINRVCGPSRF